MLPIERLRVRSLDVDSNEVTWGIAGSSMEDALDYTFQVFRSESPEGPFEPITQTFEDRYIFVDRRLPAGDKFRQIWYRLRVTKKGGQTPVFEDFGPVCRQAEPDLVANYIRRMELTLFTQATARLCWLFKRRTFGARCPSCWDPVSGKKARANCLTCYQTGFLRGYLNPIEVWIQIDPAAKAQQNQGQQAAQHTATTARTSFYPNIVPGDVIVEAENKRWRVDKVTQSERLRTPIKQELVLLQINDTDIEYKLPINLDEALRDIQPSPPRMFTNPTDIQSSIDERTPDVFANYRTYPRGPLEE
jgi:hypothetical protein